MLKAFVKADGNGRNLQLALQFAGRDEAHRIFRISCAELRQGFSHGDQSVAIGNKWQFPRAQDAGVVDIGQCQNLEEKFAGEQQNLVGSPME